MSPQVTNSSAPGEPEAVDAETRIFDAALRVFARKGKDGARLQEIADEAGIHRPLLHYYFRTKQQLYEAVAERMFNQFLATFDAPAEGGSFADTLRAFIEHYVESVREHPHAAMWMVTENMAGNPVLGEMLTRAFATEGSPQRAMVEAIERAIETGEIRPVDPRQLLLTVVSACVFFFVTLPTVKMMNPLAEEDFDAYVEQRKKHVFEVVYYGLASREVSDA
ncbi:TetR/AcrR family transcriptional regulator [Gemmatimonadota bacterium]